VMRDQCADADDRMVDVLGECIAYRGADFLRALAERIISSSKGADVGYCLNVPDENVRHLSRHQIQCLEVDTFHCRFLSCHK
jgi:hypothetical protein